MPVGKISPLINFTSSKAVRKTASSLSKNIPMITVISVVTKDLVGALVLFDKTYHNDKIPEQKRKYLASYELTSGSYNVLFPLTVGLLYTSKSFEHKLAKTCFKKYYVSPEQMAKATGEAKKALEESMKCFEKSKKGLTQFISVFFTTIISKRIICPFVGGPMATAFNKNVLQKQEQKAAQKEEQKKSLNKIS